MKEAIEEANQVIEDVKKKEKKKKKKEKKRKLAQENGNDVSTVNGGGNILSCQVFAQIGTITDEMLPF